MSPDQYVALVAVPTLSEALAKRGDRRLNYLAGISIFHVLDYLAATRGEKLITVQNPVKSLCPREFAVVQGVRNGTKHAGGTGGRWLMPGAERDVRPFGFGPDCGGWGDRWTYPGLEVIEDGQKIYLDRAAQEMLLRICQRYPAELGAIDLSFLDADLHSTSPNDSLSLHLQGPLMTRLTEEQEERFDQIVEEELRKGPPPLGISQAEQCRRQAAVFHLGAMRCMEERALSDGGYSQPTPPAIVTFAFACELYLKSLLAHSGKNSRGHGLLSLFEKLTEDQRNIIRQNYEFLSGRKSQTLDTEIEKLSDAFVEWRYVYESSLDIIVRLDRLVNITRALYVTCCDELGAYEAAPESIRILSEAPPYSLYTIVSLGDGRILAAKSSI